MLRVGIIQGPRIIDERLIRAGQPVTVGDSPGDQFTVADAPLPPRHRLFAVRDGRYQLIVPDGVTGKLFVDGAVRPLDEAARRIGRRHGALWWIPLGPRVRGKLRLGGSTLLFQFVAAPPEPRREPLGFSPLAMDQVDWVFLGFFLFSLLLNLVGIAYAGSRPAPPRVHLDDIPTRLQHVWFTENVPTPDEDPEPVAPLPGEPVGEPVPDRTIPRADRPLSPPDDTFADAGPTDPPLDRDQLRERARQDMATRGLAALLIGTPGDTTSSMSAYDRLTDTDGITTDLDDALGQTRWIVTADRGLDPELRVGRSCPTCDDVGGPTRVTGRAGGGETGPGRKDQTRVEPRLVVTAPDIDGDVDPADISAVVGRKKGQVKACYESVIKQHPDVQGRLGVRIVVAADGTVDQVTIDDNSTGSLELEGCVLRRIRRWVFPATGEIYEITYPFNVYPS